MSGKYDVLVVGAGFAGSVCAERLASEIAAMRPSHLSCFMGFAGIGRRETLGSMERFGTDVLPLLGSVLAQGGLSDAA